MYPATPTGLRSSARAPVSAAATASPSVDPRACTHSHPESGHSGRHPWRPAKESVGSSKPPGTRAPKVDPNTTRRTGAIASPPAPFAGPGGPRPAGRTAPRHHRHRAVRGGLECAGTRNHIARQRGQKPTAAGYCPTTCCQVRRPEYQIQRIPAGFAKPRVS